MVWPPFTRNHQPYLKINHEISKSSIGYTPGFCWVLLGPDFLRFVRVCVVFRYDLRSNHVSYWRDTYSKLPSIKREDHEEEDGSDPGPGF